MSHSRYASCILLLCLMSLLPSSFGFVSSSRTRPSQAAFLSTSTRLHQSSVPDEQQQQPSWVDLPRPYVSKRIQCAQAIEDGIGRVAMVGALGLIVGEVITGESVAEQVSDALSSLMA